MIERINTITGNIMYGVGGLLLAALALIVIFGVYWLFRESIRKIKNYIKHRHDTSCTAYYKKILEDELVEAVGGLILFFLTTIMVLNVVTHFMLNGEFK